MSLLSDKLKLFETAINSSFILLLRYLFFVTKPWTWNQTMSIEWSRSCGSLTASIFLCPSGARMSWITTPRTQLRSSIQNRYSPLWTFNSLKTILTKYRMYTPTREVEISPYKHPKKGFGLLSTFNTAVAVIVPVPYSECPCCSHSDWVFCRVTHQSSPIRSFSIQTKNDHSDDYRGNTNGFMLKRFFLYFNGGYPVLWVRPFTSQLDNSDCVGRRSIWKFRRLKCVKYADWILW